MPFACWVLQSIYRSLRIPDPEKILEVCSGYGSVSFWASGIRILPFSRKDAERTEIILAKSVADPGCLSRISDPDFYLSRIPDLGSRIQKQQQQKRGENFFLSYHFL